MKAQSENAMGFFCYDNVGEIQTKKHNSFGIIDIFMLYASV
jgi:hypothetical protein